MNKKLLVLPVAILLASCSGLGPVETQLKEIAEYSSTHLASDNSNDTYNKGGSFSLNRENVIYMDEAFVVYQNNGSILVNSFYSGKNIYLIASRDAAEFGFYNGSYEVGTPANMVIVDTKNNTTLVIDEFGNVLFLGTTGLVEKVNTSYFKNTKSTFVTYYTPNNLKKFTFKKYNSDFSGITELSDEEKEIVSTYIYNEEYYLPSNVTLIPGSKGTRYYTKDEKTLVIYDKTGNILSTLEVPTTASFAGFIGCNYVYQLKYKVDDYASEYDYYDNGAKFKLETYKFDIESGDLNNIDFNYYINNVNNDLGLATVPTNDSALVNANEIKDKHLCPVFNYFTNTSLDFTYFPIFGGMTSLTNGLQRLSNGNYYNSYNHILFDENLNRVHSFVGLGIEDIDTKNNLIFGVSDNTFQILNLDGKRLFTSGNYTNFLASSEGNYYVFDSFTDKVIHLGASNGTFQELDFYTADAAYPLGKNLFASYNGETGLTKVINARDGKALFEVKCGEIQKVQRAISLNDDVYSNTLCYLDSETKNYNFITYRSDKVIGK